MVSCELRPNRPQYRDTAAGTQPRYRYAAPCSQRSLPHLWLGVAAPPPSAAGGLSRPRPESERRRRSTAHRPVSTIYHGGAASQSGRDRSAPLTDSQPLARQSMAHVRRVARPAARADDRQLVAVLTRQLECPTSTFCHPVADNETYCICNTTGNTWVSLNRVEASNGCILVHILYVEPPGSSRSRTRAQYMRHRRGGSAVGGEQSQPVRVNNYGVLCPTMLAC